MFPNDELEEKDGDAAEMFPNGNESADIPPQASDSDQDEFDDGANQDLARAEGVTLLVCFCKGTDGKSIRIIKSCFHAYGIQSVSQLADLAYTTAEGYVDLGLFEWAIRDVESAKGIAQLVITERLIHALNTARAQIMTRTKPGNCWIKKNKSKRNELAQVVREFFNILVDLDLMLGRVINSPLKAKPCKATFSRITRDLSSISKKLNCLKKRAFKFLEIERQEHNLVYDEEGRQRLKCLVSDEWSTWWKNSRVGGRRSK